MDDFFCGIRYRAVIINALIVMRLNAKHISMLTNTE